MAGQSESRASDAPYAVFDGPTATTPLAIVAVNQKLAPAGSALGGVAWQSLGVFSITSGTVRVRLTDTAEANSTVAADAVRIVAVDAATGEDQVVLPALSVLDLSGNPLNNQAHDLYLGILQERLGAGLTVEANAAPTLKIVLLLDGPSRAIQFDGIDDYVEIPSSASLDLRRTVTVEFWMQADRAADGTLAFPAGKDWMPLVQKSTGALGARSYSVWLHRSGSVLVSSANALGDQFIQTAAGMVQPGQWYHVAGVVDRNAGLLRVFVNDATGALVASTSGAVRTTDAFTTRVPLEIGRTLEVEATYMPFRGTLDEVRIWNRARTAGEIATDLFTGRRGSDAGLVGFWRFEEATGPSAFDVSVNANHGWLGGAPTPLPAGGTGGPGSALRFDGVDDYVISPNLRNFFPNETVTLEGWFNPIGSGVIIDEPGIQAINNPSWHDSQIEILPTGEVRVRVWNLAPVSLGTAAFGTWHQAVLRYNRATFALDGFLTASSRPRRCSAIARRPGSSGAASSTRWAPPTPPIWGAAPISRARSTSSGSGTSPASTPRSAPTARSSSRGPSRGS